MEKWLVSFIYLFLCLSFKLIQSWSFGTLAALALQSMHQTGDKWSALPPRFGQQTVRTFMRGPQESASLTGETLTIFILARCPLMMFHRDLPSFPRHRPHFLRFYSPPLLRMLQRLLPLAASLHHQLCQLARRLRRHRHRSLFLSFSEPLGVKNSHTVQLNCD